MILAGWTACGNGPVATDSRRVKGGQFLELGVCEVLYMQQDLHTVAATSRQATNLATPGYFLRTSVPASLAAAAPGSS